jgi:DNA-binding winged helix-turn-helix (wHTH) protein
VLTVLLHARGNLVGRDELIDEAWGPGATVQPCTVDQAISRLRTDLAENGKLIITRSRRGYQVDFALVSARPIDCAENDARHTPRTASHSGLDSLCVVAKGARASGDVPAYIAHGNSASER